MRGRCEGDRAEQPHPSLCQDTHTRQGSPGDRDLLASHQHPACSCQGRSAPLLKSSQEILLHFGKYTEGICSGVERVSKHETRISMALSSLNQAVLMLGSRLSPKEAAA